uniref:Uncharacterized protein n=1 Tax=viral metagenome TaxID=1070528 RepID=A0A6C0LVV4_9ZZZZ
MEILVLCQRKKSNTKDTQKILIVNEKIVNFVKNIYPRRSHKYTFLTNCLPEDTNSDCADVKMNFDMMKEQTRNWVNINKNKFNLIIMNTCPVSLFPAHFWYGMYKLLENDESRIYMTSFTENKGSNITSDAITDLLHSKKSSIRPIRGIPLKSVNVLFDTSSGNYLLKKKNNHVIFTYLIRESCSDYNNNLIEIYTILPKYIQEFIFNVCSVVLSNKKIKFSDKTKKLSSAIFTKFVSSK